MPLSAADFARRRVWRRHCGRRIRSTPTPWCLRRCNFNASVCRHSIAASSSPHVNALSRRAICSSAAVADSCQSKRGQCLDWQASFLMRKPEGYSEAVLIKVAAKSKFLALLVRKTWGVYVSMYLYAPASGRARCRNDRGSSARTRAQLSLPRAKLLGLMNGKSAGAGFHAIGRQVAVSGPQTRGAESAAPAAARAKVRGAPPGMVGSRWGGRLKTRVGGAMYND